MRFEWKTTYLYYILVGLTLFTFFFFNGEKVDVPKWPSLFFIIFLIFGMCHQGWCAFKMHGRVCVTNLRRDRGGHSTYHPDDVRYAESKSGKPTFMVMAQGGFDYNTLSIQGKDRFLVFPPEHVEEANAGMHIHTKFRQVGLEELPDYIVSELMELKHFDARKVTMKRNLYFGGTCQNFKLQDEESVSRFLDQTTQINAYKRIVKDLTSRGTVVPWAKKEESEEDKQ